MATFVTIVNRALRRLREDEVSNYNDTEYSTLISDMLNETIAEVQGKCEWRSLVDQFTVTTDGSSLVYALTSTESANSRDSNDQLRIRNVYNDSDDYDLVKLKYAGVSRSKLYTSPSNNLWGYREVGLDTSDRRKVELYPDVSGKSVVFECYNPHAEIAASATQVLLPERVLFLGTYARAVDERGEDAGTSAANAWRLYTNLLTDAVITEVERQTDLENDWRPV